MEEMQPETSVSVWIGRTSHFLDEKIPPRKISKQGLAGTQPTRASDSRTPQGWGWQPVGNFTEKVAAQRNFLNTLTK